MCKNLLILPHSTNALPYSIRVENNDAETLWENGMWKNLLTFPHSYILPFSTKVLNNVAETLWENGMWKIILILPHSTYILQYSYVLPNLTSLEQHFGNIVKILHYTFMCDDIYANKYLSILFIHTFSHIPTIICILSNYILFDNKENSCKQISYFFTFINYFIFN